MNRKQQRVCKILVAWLVIASLGVSGFPGPQAEVRQGTAVSLSYPLLQATQAPPTGYPPPEVTTIPPTLPPPPLASPTPPPIPTPSEWVQIALNYVSERYGIPIENLLVVNEHTRSYPLSGRTFQAITLLDTLNLDKFGYKFEYSLLIDLSTRSIEEDLAAIQAAEDAAYLAKYGKLQPALYERLQAVGDDTVLPVAIWIANQGQERTDAEIYAELAAQFPAAAEALTRGTKPFDVADPDLSEQIQAAYQQLHAQDITVRNKPLLDWLEKQGMSVEQQVGMPALTARLPKRIIMELATRSEVGMIYLVEKQGSYEMDTAAATDHAPAVWQRGITGGSIRVAVLDADNVDSSAGCFNVVVTRAGSGGLTSHATRVGSIIACAADPYRGVAYGADLISAGFNNTGWEISQEDAVAALQWAIQSPQNADVVNTSIGWEDDNNLNWTDRAFDYWARQENVTIVKSAGNEGEASGCVTSPGKGWNIITVGATDDHNTAYWMDDDMAGRSSYVNPGGDREKPEVVAPGIGITARERNGDITTEDGTSYAAPQVAGLVALLMQRHTSLRVWPEAVKAAIMASAVHNVEGPSHIPLGSDLKDGAGSVDAALADNIAQTRAFSGTVCAGPCWWGIATSSSNPPVWGWIDQYFKASQGERIRVAISWYSHADAPALPCCANLANDRLDTNYNLLIFKPSGGSSIASSVSMDNNYELVDFVAPETGQYTIRVHRSGVGDNNEASNSIGIAWVKDATYLPDVKSGYNGWNSEIVIRHDSAEPITVTASLFNTNGSYAGGVTYYYLQPNAVWRYNPSRTNFTGSAIVSGGEDVSVVVRQERLNGTTYELDEYNGLLASGGSLGWEQVGATTYAPVVKKSFSNPARTSTLFIMNAGSATTTASVQLYDANGNPAGGPTSVPISVNGQAQVASNNCASANPTRCSAKITADQPLAVVIFEQGDAAPYSPSGSNAFRAGATTNFVPVVKNKWGSPALTTGLVVQNLDATTAIDVSVTCYAYPTGTASNCGQKIGLAARASAPFWMGSIFGTTVYSGSAVITTNPARPIAAIMQESDTANALVYAANAPLSGALTAYAPEVYGYYSQGGVAWDSGLTVQNTHSSSNATVTVTYYDANGNLMTGWTQANVVIGPRRSQVFSRWRNTLPWPEFFGSAVMTSNQPIVATVNTSYTGSGDTGASYTASNR